MPDKSFEITIPFVETDEDGWQPVVEVVFLRPNSPELTFSLVFDTGAEDICLSAECEWAFPNLQLQLIDGVGDEAPRPGKIARGGQIRFLGRVVDWIFCSHR